MMLVFIAFVVVQCSEGTSTNPPQTTKTDYHGFDSEVKWGEHLVTVGACHDCHSPKRMTAMGPVIDTALMLSGHHAGHPEPQVDRAEVQRKGLAVTNDLTTWVGVWGTSYTANLTPDATGLGNWKKEQFKLALREGKFKGLAGNRTLLPPMPWEMYRNFSDEEISAIFAYLQSIPAIKNVVPEALPPVKL